MNLDLANPARYFPITRGVYEVTAGLKPLGTDFGNGDADHRVFQIDRDFERYRANKLACHADRFDRHTATHDLDTEAERALNAWLIDRLTNEYPAIFSVSKHDGGRLWIDCQRTGDGFAIGEGLALDRGRSRLGISYRSTFDALACQVPEDICLMRAGARGDWLAAAHVCSPSGWSPAEKIGQPFAAIHAPVPHIEKINSAADQFIETMIHRGPFVRFVWGIAITDRLNRHPDLVKDDLFIAGKTRLFVRVERQITWGLPVVNAAVFTIRVSHLDVEQLRADPPERQLLRSALMSMSLQSLQYKGLAGSIEAILSWL